MTDIILQGPDLVVGSTFDYVNLSQSAVNQLIANGDFSQLAYNLSRVHNNPLSAKTSFRKIPNEAEAKSYFLTRVRDTHPEWFQVQQQDEVEPLESAE